MPIPIWRGSARKGTFSVHVGDVWDGASLCIKIYMGGKALWAFNFHFALSPNQRTHACLLKKSVSLERLPRALKPCNRKFMSSEQKKISLKNPSIFCTFFIHSQTTLSLLSPSEIVSESHPHTTQEKRRKRTGGKCIERKKNLKVEMLRVGFLYLFSLKGTPCLKAFTFHMERGLSLGDFLSHHFTLLLLCSWLSLSLIHL